MPLDTQRNEPLSKVRTSTGPWLFCRNSRAFRVQQSQSCARCWAGPTGSRSALLVPSGAFSVSVEAHFAMHEDEKTVRALVRARPLLRRVAVRVVDGPD